MKKILLIGIVCLILCGCDNRKCIKSHTETRTYMSTSCIPIGNYQSCITTPHTHTVSVCDKYEVIK